MSYEQVREDIHKVIQAQMKQNCRTTFELVDWPDWCKKGDCSPEKACWHWEAIAVTDSLLSHPHIAVLSEYQQLDKTGITYTSGREAVHELFKAMVNQGWKRTIPAEGQ